jgi:hypothetical protein
MKVECSKEDKRDGSGEDRRDGGEAVLIVTLGGGSTRYKI